VPAPRNGPAILWRKGVDRRLAEQFVEHIAMHLVDIIAGLDDAEHPLQRATPVLIGEAMPIALDAAPRSALGEHGDKAAVPVEDRPPVSKASTLISCIPGSSARTAHARCRHHEITGDQFEPLVVARQTRLAQCMDRGARRGLVPEPVAELAAPGATGKRTFGTGLLRIEPKVAATTRSRRRRAPCGR